MAEIHMEIYFLKLFEVSFHDDFKTRSFRKSVNKQHLLSFTLLISAIPNKCKTFSDMNHQFVQHSSNYSGFSDFKTNKSIHFL